MPQQSAIRFNNVDAHRRNRLALDQVSLDIPPGTVTSVIGPNGAGKSTMLGLISGRLRATRGKVAVDGDAAEVMQFGSIDAKLPLTVEDVVRQGRYRDRGLFRPMTRTDRRIVDRSLESVDMADHRRRPVPDLSGGQRQRVLVAQGLAQQAPILLLDEPTSGVDAPTQNRLSEVIQNVAETGVTVVYSTHSMRDAARADMTVALACHCVCCAPTNEALSRSEVKELFESSSDAPIQRR